MTTPQGSKGLKGKATELGTKAYLAAPPKAQTAILTGIGKAQPVVDAVKPHAKKLAGAATGVWLLRKLRT